MEVLGGLNLRRLVLFLLHDASGNRGEASELRGARPARDGDQDKAASLPPAQQSRLQHAIFFTLSANSCNLSGFIVSRKF